MQQSTVIQVIEDRQPHLLRTNKVYFDLLIEIFQALWQLDVKLPCLIYRI